jgi:hypothetical protein
LTITSTGSVTVTASQADAIDGGTGVAWSINNSGTVTSYQSAADAGISLNGAGSSIVNSGKISGYSSTGGYGVNLEAGGTLTNTSAGYITGGEDAIITGDGTGVTAPAGAATINNSGQIVSTFDDGLSLFAGGSVINNAGGVIQAPTSGGFGPAGVYIPSGSADVINHGSISGQTGVYLGVAGTVENAGTITGTSWGVNFAASGSTLIVDPGAVFNGGANGNGGALELTKGSGSIGTLGPSYFSGFQTLTVDAGGNWTLTAASNSIPNVTNNGILVVPAAGSLDVTTAVSVSPTSTGQFDLQAGSSLEVAADAAANSVIDFLGNSQLTIDSAALFGNGKVGTSYAGPLLENFVAGDTIDLHGISATAGTYTAATGLLQIGPSSSPVATLDLQNNPTLATGTFSFASDGSGGTKITV